MKLFLVCFGVRLVSQEGHVSISAANVRNVLQLENFVHYEKNPWAVGNSKFLEQLGLFWNNVEQWRQHQRKLQVTYRYGATFDISQDVKLLQARFGGDTVWTKKEMLSPISH